MNSENNLGTTEGLQPTSIKIEKYNIYLRAIHWLMALVIIALLISGFTKDYWPKDTQGSFYFWHKSFGATILGLVILRLIVKISTTTPNPLKNFTPIEVLLAKLGTFGFYILMFIAPLTGILMSDAGDYKVSVFGWFNLPDFIEKSKSLGEIFHESHEVIGFLFAIIILLHICAVIKHRIKDKTNLLERML